MEYLNLFYRRVLESLKLLALPFSEQKRCFEDFVDAPFEVLDTYHNVFLQLPKLIEANRFSNAQIAALIRLYNNINFTASNPNLNDLEEIKFSTHALWNEIREQAKEVLRLLEEPIEYPDNNYF